MRKEELIAWLGMATAIINLAVALLNIRKEAKKRESGSPKKKSRKRK